MLISGCGRGKLFRALRVPPPPLIKNPGYAPAAVKFPRKSWSFWTLWDCFWCIPRQILDRMYGRLHGPCKTWTGSSCTCVNHFNCMCKLSLWFSVPQIRFVCTDFQCGFARSMQTAVYRSSKGTSWHALGIFTLWSSILFWHTILHTKFLGFQGGGNRVLNGGKCPLLLPSKCNPGAWLMNSPHGYFWECKILSFLCRWADIDCGCCKYRCCDCYQPLWCVSRTGILRR